MAEIRKHNPAAGALGDLVRAAIGGTPRPAEPGSVTAGADPFDTANAPRHEPVIATVTATGATSISLGWTAVRLDQLPTVPKRTESDDESDEDDDL